MNPVDLGLVTWVKGELEKFFSVDGQEKNQKDVSSCWWYRTIGKVVYQFFMYVYTFVSFQCFFLGFLYSALGVDGWNTDDIVYPTIDDILCTSQVVVQDFFQQSAPPLVLS